MNEKIILINQNIANYVMFKLNKLNNEFNEEDLLKITELTIDYEESEIVILKEILLFRNLQSLIIRNAFIYNNNFNYLSKLKKLKDICFDNCEFENADLISSLNLKSLSLISCNLINYSFVYSMFELEELSIVNGKIRIDGLNNLNNLIYLQISYSNVFDTTIDLKLNNLVELYIDNTNIYDFLFINNLPNIKRLSIDKKQYQKNKELMQKLRKKSINIYNKNFYLFDGDKNEI